MKLSVVTLAAIVASVSGAPTPINIGDILESVSNLLGGHESSPDFFSSMFVVKATPDEVVDNANSFTGGLAGAEGLYKYAISSHSDVICYDITLWNFQGDFESPAISATHIHQGLAGKSGPPRIAFPDPVEIGHGVRNSKGCLKGPFTTGVMANGTDTGAGFKVASIEQNPAEFFTDVHSSLAVPGAVRGQLKK
ncbi:unnamed protein product [Discula destructiva]